MAKNVQSTAYRKIDVDALDEEKFEEMGDESDSTTFIDEKAVQSLLQSGRTVDALHSVLVNQPLSKIDQKVKDSGVEVACRVLQSFRSPSQVESAVEGLSVGQVDVLCKLVYRAFELLADGALCQSLLVWHAQIVNKFGKGPIVRTLASRNRL